MQWPSVRQVCACIIPALVAAVIVACSDVQRPTAIVALEVSTSHIEFPCDEYQEHPDCQEEYWWLPGGGLEGTCNYEENCTYYKLKSDPQNRFYYFQEEIDRLKNHSDQVCRTMGTAAQNLWSNDWVSGFDNAITRWDAKSRSYAFLFGDWHPQWLDDTGPAHQQVHIFIGGGGGRARQGILSDFRHEVAHAVGIVDETLADVYADMCK